MKNYKTYILCITLALAILYAPVMSAATTKQERNAIVSGNKLYHDKRYAEAEVQFRKALEANASSETAMFNLAAALIRQGGTPSAKGQNKTLQEASSLLGDLSTQAKDVKLAELAAYNLGNLAFNAGDYGASIEQYKNALRRNPMNNNARENLRLAQKKLQQQNQDKKDQDNKDKNNDKDKEQDKQDQKQDQPQNKDQNKDQKKEEQQPPQEEKGGISDNNAERILKAMENEEKATRARINSRQQKNGNPANSRTITKPW